MTNGEDQKTEQKTDQKPVYAGILTTAGLAGFIMQLKMPDEQKLMYIAILVVGGFAAFIVRFFLRLYESHVSKQTDTLMALLHEGRMHDTRSADANEKHCNALDAQSATLREMAQSLKSMNGKVVK